MQLEILEAHNPQQQFDGPISALTMYLKHKELLSSNLADVADQRKFASNNDVIRNVLDFLYNADLEGLNAEIIGVLRSDGFGDDADILEKALQISRDFTPEMRLNSINYMNHWFKFDVHFIVQMHIKCTDDIMDESNQITSYICNDDYNSDDIIPIKFPDPIIATTKLGIYNSVDELYAYVSGVYGGAYGGAYGRAYDAYVYESYRALEVDPRVAMTGYLQDKFSNPRSTGIFGWKYSPGQQLSDQQMASLVSDIMSHFNTNDRHRFAHEVIASMRSYHGRLLEQQVQASMSHLMKNRTIQKNIFRKR